MKKLKPTKLIYWISVKKKQTLEVEAEEEGDPGTQNKKPKQTQIKSRKYKIRKIIDFATQLNSEKLMFNF